MSDSVSAMFSIIVTFFLIAVIIIYSGISYSMNSITSFKQNVNYQLETNGGLNATSCKLIEDYAIAINGNYKLLECYDSSNKMITSTTKVGLGKEVRYTIGANFMVAFGGKERPPIYDENGNPGFLSFDVPGVAVSKVRGDR